MNRSTIIANVSDAEMLTDWEEAIRGAWPKKLRDLDAAYIFLYEHHEALSQLCLIFRDQNNNTHRNTDWFLIDPIEKDPAKMVTHYDRQDQLFADVKPAQGVCITLWKRGFWQEMARSSYNLAMKHDRVSGLYLNMAEV